MKNQIFIQGRGIVSAIGNTKKNIVTECKSGKAKPQTVSLPHSIDKPLPYYFVDNNHQQRDADALYDYIKAATSDAIADADLSAEEIQKLGIFFGTSSNEIGVLEKRYQHDLQTVAAPYPLTSNGFGELMAFIADQFNIQGPQYNFITACSSSANALIYAAQMIRTHKIEHALVVGTESFNYMSTYGFHAMTLLSEQQCLPFDARRDGIVLGEGVGAVVLGTRQSANNPYYIKSGANLCDTGGVTSSSPETIAHVMQQALTRASLSVDDISAIKAHGTSTVSNDTAEGQAMSMVFNANVPAFTSLKPYVGHTMGACGTIELICLLACLDEGFIPSTPGFSVADENLHITPLTDALPYDGGKIMLNFFGFGGNNSTFIISKQT